MPLSSGLGSSAASAVAAVFAANLLAGSPLSRRELLPFTMEAESVACGSAHADNVAPSLLGGFVLIRSYEPLDVVQLPVPAGLSCAVAHPHAELRTEDARRMLKKEIRLSDAIRQWGNLAALVAALYNGDLQLLGRSLQDVVAEPARSLLIPGFAAVKAAALAAGALGCSISGSGPSVFALCATHAKTPRAPGMPWSRRSRAAGLACDLYLSAVNHERPRRDAAGRAQEDAAVRFASRAHPEQVVSFREALFTGSRPTAGCTIPWTPRTSRLSSPRWTTATPSRTSPAEIVRRPARPEMTADRRRRLARARLPFLPCSAASTSTSCSWSSSTAPRARSRTSARSSSPRPWKTFSQGRRAAHPDPRRHLGRHGKRGGARLPRPRRTSTW